MRELPDVGVRKQWPLTPNKVFQLGLRETELTCSVVGALLIDAETVYDPRLTNDRLLLGMKGTISEMVPL